MVVLGGFPKAGNYARRYGNASLPGIGDAVLGRASC
jgi:hypothetical protein